MCTYIYIKKILTFVFTSWVKFELKGSSHNFYTNAHTHTRLWNANLIQEIWNEHGDQPDVVIHEWGVHESMRTVMVMAIIYIIYYYFKRE